MKKSLLILTFGLLAYANSFSVPFLFDDAYFILEPAARGYFSSWWRALLPPPNFQPWIHRPLVALTLALNYNLGGTAVWGYHAVNLSIHLANAALILVLLRRRIGRPAAWAAALLWAVHPLQTESVTYIYQRAESLMALFTLLTLYGLTRAAESPSDKRWSWLTVAACAAGMMGKQTMVVVPALALLYDRVFLAGSWKELWRRRGRLHLTLIATWGIVAALLLLAGRNGVPSNAGFSFNGISPWQYARTEPSVVLHYLRLAAWPHPLVLDYFWPVEHSRRVILFSAAAVGALLLLTLRGLRRKPELGFWGAWFFLLLAPVSSIVPSNDIAAEHRMYLPLLGVVVLSVLALARALKKHPRLFRGIIGAVALLLGMLTFQRNLLYRDPVLLWRDTAAHRPGNPRAWESLAILLHSRGQVEEAAQAYLGALRAQPNFSPAYDNLGFLYQQQGDPGQAMTLYLTAIRIKPDESSPYNHIGTLFFAQGDWKQSRSWFQKAVEISPFSPEAVSNLGAAYHAEGNRQEAARCYTEALRLQPGRAATLSNLRKLQSDAQLPPAR